MCKSQRYIEAAAIGNEHEVQQSKGLTNIELTACIRIIIPLMKNLYKSNIKRISKQATKGTLDAHGVVLFTNTIEKLETADYLVEISY